MYILQCPLHHHQDIEPFRSIVLFYNQQILGSKHFSDLFLNHRLFLPISELRIKGYMQYIVVCTSFILLIIMFKIHPYGSPCQQFSSSVVFSFFFFLFFAQYYSGICIYCKLSILLEITTNCMAVIRNPLSAQAQRRSSQSSFCHYWSWFLLQHPTAYEKGTRKQIYRLLHISFLFGSTCYLACLLFQSKTQYQFRNKIVTTHTINECFQEK